MKVRHIRKIRNLLKDKEWIKKQIEYYEKLSEQNENFRSFKCVAFFVGERVANRNYKIYKRKENFLNRRLENLDKALDKINNGWSFKKELDKKKKFLEKEPTLKAHILGKVDLLGIKVKVARLKYLEEIKQKYDELVYLVLSQSAPLKWAEYGDEQSCQEAYEFEKNFLKVVKKHEEKS